MIDHMPGILFTLNKDLDECKTNIHTCDKNAICINQVGGYKCRCRDGYDHLNNGRLCLKTGTIIFLLILRPQKHLKVSLFLFLRREI